MDWVVLRKAVGKHWNKYKFALLILAVGLLFMSFPKEEEHTLQQPEASSTLAEVSLEQRLSTILGRIQGVGEVQVLLTEAWGKEAVYQTDGTSGMDGRLETVIIKDDSRKEAGLVKQVRAPVYQGAVVVCQGGDNANVRLSIVEAVANATGISSSRITVLKMN